MKRISVASALAVSLLLLLGAGLPPFTGAQDRARRDLTHKRVGKTPQEAEKGKVELWALVIGISHYLYGDQEIDGLKISNLNYATTDAKSIYDFLQSDAGGGFRDVSNGGHMILLTDEEATKANIEKALKSMTEAKPEDYFVIYVAGHGHIGTDSVRDPQTGSETKVSVPYFVLHDTNPRDLKRTGLDMGWFRQTVEREIPAKRGLVLLDTCHSGGIVQPGMARDKNELSNREFISQLSGIAGIGFITAASALESSFEQAKLDHGVFTYCLLEALRGAADVSPTDYIVNFDEVVAYLRKRVPQLTEGQQNPYPYTTWINANYIPLSIVHYAGPESAGAKFATVVIHNPAVEGVEVAIDNEPAENAPVGIEVSSQVTAGSHKIYYSQKGSAKNELPVTIEPGETKEIEIKLCFSEKEMEDRPPSLPTSVYLQDKEPTPEARDFFHKGVDSFNRQKFKEAYDFFNRAIKANGGYSHALVYRGRTEQSLGLSKQAVDTYTEALKLKPTDFETQTLLAEAKFVAGGDIKGVYDTLRYITTTYPTYDFAHVVLGDVLLWRKETIRAERELRRAVVLNPKSPPAHLILADALTYQPIKEKQREAVDEAEKALKLFQDLASKQVTFKGWSISHLIFGGGRYVNVAAIAEAHYVLAKALTRAVEYDPGLSDRNGYLNRARVSIQEAIKASQEQRDKVRMTQVLVTSAQNYILKEDLTSAIKDGEQALRLSEPTPHTELKALAHHVLYQAYASNQKCGKAAEHLQAYIDATHTTTEQDRLELKRLKDCAEAHRQDR